MFPLITLEEHYISQSFLTNPSNAHFFHQFPEHARNRLTDLSHGRIAAMDAGAVTKQVLSHGAGTGTAAQCRAANDQLAAAVREHPDRFAGFAALAMAEPDEAVKELKRCVNELGFVGALIENHQPEDELGAEMWYDAEKYWTVFEAATELDVVLYLHPSLPSDEMEAKLYRGNYAMPAQKALGAFGWGWHSMTALHVLRMYAAGVFDRFPKLKLVIGHMGEMLPFQLDRILAQDANGKGRLGQHERGLRTVWDENLWITTSGMFTLPPMACVLQQVKKDRIMFSVDYPFSMNEQGKEFIELLEKSGLVTEEELKDIGYRNAAKLLRLDVR